MSWTSEELAKLALNYIRENGVERREGTWLQKLGIYVIRGKNILGEDDVSVYAYRTVYPKGMLGNSAMGEVEFQRIERITLPLFARKYIFKEPTLLDLYLNPPLKIYQLTTKQKKYLIKKFKVIHWLLWFRYTLGLLHLTKAGREVRWWAYQKIKVCRLQKEIKRGCNRCPLLTNSIYSNLYNHIITDCIDIKSIKLCKKLIKFLKEA